MVLRHGPTRFSSIPYKQQCKLITKKNTSNMKKTTKAKPEGPSAKAVEGVIAEIDFGLGTTAPAKGKPPKFPLLEGKEVPELVDAVLILEEKYDAVADPFKSAKQELIQYGFPKFFAVNQGRIGAPSSMLAWGKRGGVRVTWKDRYTGGDKARIIELLGPELAGQWFHQSWVIKIDGDAIPIEEGPGLVADLKKVMAAHNASHALSIKAQILPVADFTSKRHFAFDPDVNMQIQELVPQQASVSSKGVR
jgi:hypothetical protein